MFAELDDPWELAQAWAAERRRLVAEGCSPGVNIHTAKVRVDALDLAHAAAEGALAYRRLQARLAAGRLRLENEREPEPPSRPPHQVEQPRKVADVTMPRPGVEPSGPMLEALWFAYPRAKQAADRDAGLPSPSEHDLSLAGYAARAGWAPQDVADLLGWNRRRRGEDQKHLTYYRRTVGLAMADQDERASR